MLTVTAKALALTITLVGGQDPTKEEARQICYAAASKYAEYYPSPTGYDVQCSVKYRVGTPLQPSSPPSPPVSSASW